MALDLCDEENAASGSFPVDKIGRFSAQSAPTSESFTDITAPLRDDTELVPVLMDPGDVLFFHGSLVQPSSSLG